MIDSWPTLSEVPSINLKFKERKNSPYYNVIQNCARRILFQLSIIILPIFTEMLFCRWNFKRFCYAWSPESERGFPLWPPCFCSADSSSTIGQSLLVVEVLRSQGNQRVRLGFITSSVIPPGALFLLHVAVQSGHQEVKAKVPFPPIPSQPWMHACRALNSPLGSIFIIYQWSL